MIVVGLSHRNAPIQVRERLAIAPAEMPETLERFKALDALREVVLLSTCNRVEVFAVPTEPMNGGLLIQQVTRLLDELGGRMVTPHLRFHQGRDAVHHLFRVATSLDSLVVGEPQVLGQLKEAIRMASESGCAGPVLNQAMRNALQLAKRVRTRTSIGAGQVSVPSVAIDLARQIFDRLSEQTTLLIGAGEMAETAAKLLARAGAQIIVTNRSPKRAEQLAMRVGGTTAPWNELASSLIKADIVISSTASPTPVVTRKLLESIRRKRRGRSLFIIDIAVPRDVEPTVHEMDHVYLYDVDDLSQVVAQSLDGRRAEAQQAESMVNDEVESFSIRRTQLAVTPLIVALRERTREIFATELERSYRSRLKHLPDDDREALTVMVEAAVNKLMHAPTQRLKQLATTPHSGDSVQALCDVFDLSEAAHEVAKAVKANSEAPLAPDPELEAGATSVPPLQPWTHDDHR